MKLVLYPPSCYDKGDVLFFEYRDKFAAEFYIFTKVENYLSHYPKIITSEEAKQHRKDGDLAYDLFYSDRVFYLNGMILRYTDYITALPRPPRNPILRSTKGSSYMVKQIEPVVKTLEEFFNSNRTSLPNNIRYSIFKYDYDKKDY